MRKVFLSLCTALILLSSITANAVLNMGGKTIFTGTVIEVLEPGPATQIQAMITNITDASASKPYLIHLGPGVYDLGSTNIVMKEWVSLQGSGQQITKITAAVSTATGDATSAVLVGINNVSLADLTIENTGNSNAQSIAIYNDNTSPRIERVSATASGGTTVNTGVVNTGSSDPTMTNLTASASGGTFSYGVYNKNGASPIMLDNTASATGASVNHGVRNHLASPTMTNVTATASGGGTNYGMHYASASSPVMTNVTATGSGTNAYGLYIEVSAPPSTPFIQDSVLEGSTKGLYIDVNSTGTRVANSKIIGGFTDNATGTQCLGNYNAALADVGPC